MGLCTKTKMTVLVLNWMQRRKLCTLSWMNNHSHQSTKGVAIPKIWIGLAQTWNASDPFYGIQLIGTILHEWSMNSWAWCKEYWMLAWREHETDSFHMTAIINWTWVTSSGRDRSPGNHRSMLRTIGQYADSALLSHDMLSLLSMLHHIFMGPGEV